MIKQIKQVAEERGGKCLSETYTHSRLKLLWECAKGHQWEAAPSGVKRGTWCPHCAQKVKRTIEEMHQVAKDRGGRCLSETYKDTHTRLLWECSEGHQWEAAPVNIRVRGRWCPTCRKASRRSIKDMQKVAEERGGRCLSSTYKNSITKLLWECSEGHQWEALPDNILSGTWCRKCYIAKRYSHPKREQSE